MGRAPCCEKMGLKKGPWTPEEDRILIDYVQKHGHSNWRALPKLAGLLRCGKSCRLRWINYLRPDIKRGNFSNEEEDTIIQLHEMLGNRWSAIAAKLPGRTDNEIKNVWHTHIKKKIKQKNASNNQQYVAEVKCGSNAANQSKSISNSIIETQQGLESSGYAMSPQPSSCTENSIITDGSITKWELTDNVNEMMKDEYVESWENFPVIDDAFWSETEFADHSSMEASSSLHELQWNHSQLDNIAVEQPGYVPDMDDNMDFWYNIFVKTGGIHELL